jgi:hypothetical protein
MKYLIIILASMTSMACHSRKKAGKSTSNQNASVQIEAPAEGEIISEGPRPMEPTIVLGKYCGHCRGNCVSLYRVGENTYDVRADRTNDLLTKSENELVFTTNMNQTECEIAQEIRNILPPELLSQKGQTYGCPDCADQCGYFVKIINEGTGVSQSFRIDTNKEALPDFLKAFPAQVSIILAKLAPKTDN